MRLTRLGSLLFASATLACGAPALDRTTTGTVPTGLGALVRDLAKASDNNTTNSSLAIGLTGSVKVHVGDRVIVSVQGGLNSPGAVSCSDTKGNTYTIDARVGGTATQPLLYICSSLITTEMDRADTITVTYPTFNGISLASAVEFSGVGALDKIAFAVGASAAPSSGLTGTTSQADELIFGVANYNGNVNFTPGAGFFEVGPVNFGGGPSKRSLSPEYKFVSSTGTYAGNGTLSGTASWRAIVATYRVDTTAPSVSITSVSPTLTQAGTSITWSADEVGTYEVRVGASCSTGTVVESGNYFPPSTNHVTSIAAASLAEGANSIFVCVTDSGTNLGFASTTVTKDSMAPTVTISGASPNPTSAGTTLTFSGSEGGTYEVRIGGSSCSTGTVLATGAYTSGALPVSISAASLSEGANLLRVCLTDSATNVGSAAITVTKDTVTPTVTIVSTVPSSTRNTNVVVTWSASETGTYSVRVAGTDCTTGTVVASGTYATAGSNVGTSIAATSFAQGSNTVRVCVLDGALNAGSATSTVFRDSVAPIVTTVVAPTPNPTNADTSYTWTSNESGSFTVRINSTGCGNGTVVESGAYTTPANHVSAISAASLLPDTTNTIRVCVTDALNNTGTRLVSVVQDQTAPSVAISSISPSPTSAGTTVTWQASENGTFSVQVGGTSCANGTVVVSGTYSTSPSSRATAVAAASLSEGPNTLRVCVTDSATNVGSATGSVTKDTTPPTVVIDSLTPNPTAAGTSVTWHADDNGAFSVRVGGTSCTDGTVAGSGTYASSPATQATSISSGLLAEGSNTVRVCVADALGNTGSTTMSVVKDSMPPVVTVLCSPPTTGAGSVSWSATEDGASFSVRVGSTSCSDGTVVESGSYTAPAQHVTSVPAVNLGEGDNSVRVCIQDDLGNEGSSLGSVVHRSPISVNLAVTAADRSFVGSTLKGEFGSMALGDVTGDSVVELLAAERPGRNASGTLVRKGAGTVYGFSGGATFFNGSTTTVPTGALFQILGGDVGDDLAVQNNGHLVAGIDITGDGIGDIVVSAPRADGVANGRLDAGEVYVISGGSGLTGLIDLATDVMPAAVFSRIIGPVAGGATQLLAVSDVNGDGIGDLLIGVPLASPLGRTQAGEVYVLAGGAGLAGQIDLASAPHLARFEGGAAGDELGTAGDFGDFGGTAAVDVLLGAPLSRGYLGSAFGVFGPIAGDYDLATDADVRWDSDFSARLGQSVAVANVRGTARGDVILSGRRLNSPTPVVVGGALVFTGPVSPGVVAVNNPGTYGNADAAIFGQDYDDNLGAAFSHADFDGDGYEDLVLGAYRSDGAGNAIDAAGSGAVVLGGACMGTTDLATDVAPYLVDGDRVGGHLGRFAEGVLAGDIDGDGLADFCLASQIGANGEAHCFRSPW